ncbi:Uncharacterised protein [uncultured archaeon]|nr:Uncharacterised protein [uncultured archaeon]
MWTGKCAVGIYPGVRKFPGCPPVTGMFGLIGTMPGCNEPVTARCQFYDKGKLWPYYWLACSNPEHRKNAGVIQELDEQGRVIRTIKILDTRPVVIDTTTSIADEPEIKRRRKTKKDKPMPKKKAKSVLDAWRDDAKKITGTQLAKRATMPPGVDNSPIHPIFKRILGHTMLALAHPGGFNEGMREQVFQEMMAKTHNWLAQKQGRAVHVANDGTDITFMFLQDGKECKDPF